MDDEWDIRAPLFEGVRFDEWDLATCWPTAEARFPIKCHFIGILNTRIMQGHP